MSLNKDTWDILNAVWNKQLHPIEAHQKIIGMFGLEIETPRKKSEGTPSGSDRFHEFKGEGNICLTCGLHKFEHC